MITSLADMAGSKNFNCTLLPQRFGYDGAECFRRVRRTNCLSFCDKLAIERCHHGPQAKLASLKIGIGRQRNLTAPTKQRCYSTFCNDCPHGRQMVHLLAPSFQIITPGGNFNCQCPLAGRRQNLFRLKKCTDPRQQTKALKASCRQDNGCIFALIKLAQAGINIATQGANRQMRVLCGNAGLPTQTAGANKASRGSSRSRTAASTNPCGNSIGRSFKECTAKSARPSAIATSSSLINKPLPPTLDSDLSRIWSPSVVIPRT